MNAPGNILSGLVDLHVHSSPDVRVRRMDDIDLMEAGVSNNVRAIVIKSHVAPTACRAAIVNRVRKEKYPYSDFEMFGGVTLNKNVGGVNPDAVDACLKVGGKIVWLPTLHAENHLAKEGKSGGVKCVENGKAVEPLKKIFDLVAAADAVLATGHLSPEEIFVVVRAAREAGVGKILVNHPEHNLVEMNEQDQRRLIDEYGVYIERCYAQPVGGGVYKSNLAANCATFKRLGVANFVVATDAGQVENPPWNEEVAEYVSHLLRHGVSQSDVDILTRKNPGFLLGLSK